MCEVTMDGGLTVVVDRGSAGAADVGSGVVVDDASAPTVVGVEANGLMVMDRTEAGGSVLVGAARLGRGGRGRHALGIIYQ